MLQVILGIWIWIWNENGYLFWDLLKITFNTVIISIFLKLTLSEHEMM